MFHALLARKSRHRGQHHKRTVNIKPVGVVGDFGLDKGQKFVAGDKSRLMFSDDCLKGVLEIGKRSMRINRSLYRRKHQSDVVNRCVVVKNDVGSARKQKSHG